MEIKIPGKTCIVIRANSRIGYAIVEGLAKQFSSFSYVCFWNFVLLSLKLDIMINETVYLVCRNKEGLPFLIFKLKLAIKMYILNFLLQ